MTSTAQLLAPSGTPLFSVNQVRAIESAHKQIDLMRRAGKAAAEFLIRRTRSDARVVLFAGPGNNGGDALACAAELAVAGYAPVVVLLGDPEKFGADAARAWRRVDEVHLAAGATPSPQEGEGWGEGEVGAKNNPSAPHQSPSPPHPPGLKRRGGEIVVTREIPAAISADWIVDGLFGIGLKRPLQGVYSDAARAIATARANGTTVLALDVPSGIDADTGALVGDVAVVADHTVAFLALRPGLLTGPAVDYVGAVHCEPLGAELGINSLTQPVARALGSAYIDVTRVSATTNAHKGSHGTCVILGGATGMLGAALLASRAAMRCGAGKVKLGWLADPAPQVDPQMPEVMMAKAAELVATACDSLVIGCGLGVSGEAVRLLSAALKRDVPIIVDADALNLIAQSAELATLMQRRQSPTVITPHPAEAARLLGCSTAAVQADRLHAAADLAKGYCCIAVLKGAGTVVCCAAGTTINATGNPLLATAGTGDVLAGMIGALLAQGYAAATAARLAVCLHGAAADAMRERGVKRAVASDVVSALRWL